MTTTSSLSSRNSSPGPVDHHTIAKLAPTLLKTTGNFPSPSPAVVDPSGIGGNQSHSPSPPSSSPAATPGTGKGPKSNSSSGGHINPANMFDTPNQEEAPPNPQGSGHVKQWDDDEEFSSNTFDYFNGPDMGGDYELTTQALLPISIIERIFLQNLEVWKQRVQKMEGVVGSLREALPVQARMEVLSLLPLPIRSLPLPMPRLLLLEIQMRFQ